MRKTRVQSQVFEKDLFVEKQRYEDGKGEAEAGTEGSFEHQSTPPLMEFFKYNVSVESVGGLEWLSIGSSFVYHEECSLRAHCK